MVMAAANVVLSIVLVDAIGLSGPIWGTVLSYSLFVAIPLGAALPRIILNVERERSPDPLPTGGA